MKRIVLIPLALSFVINSCDNPSENNHYEQFNEELKKYVDAVVNNFDTIPTERKAELEEIALYISTSLKSRDSANLVFVCTHNSRRSQMAEVWAETAAYYYNIKGISTFSGGTESTAFNHRSVAALKRAGLTINKMDKDTVSNPKYSLQQGESFTQKQMFSKKYDDNFNPSENFAAIMVCSHADENCPFVPGAEKRIAIPYDDPKEFDGTEKESQAYDERSLQIAGEMFYMISKVTAK